MNNENTKRTLPEVRAVEGYDPAAKMIKIMDQNNRESLYLEVKYRKDWFLRWCQANGKQGLLDDSEIAYNPTSKMVEGKAFIYVEGKLFAKSIAAKPYDPERMADFSSTIFQDVGTIAIGRALANAGFGTVNCCLEDGDTRTVLADAPVNVPASSSLSPSKPDTSPSRPLENNPMQELLKQGSAAKKQASTTQATRTQQPTQPQQTAQSQPSAQTTPAGAKPARFSKKPDIALPRTVEEARQAIMPIGNYAGRTLGEIYTALNRNSIIYCAGRASRPFNRPEYPNLTKACQMILDANAF